MIVQQKEKKLSFYGSSFFKALSLALLRMLFSNNLTAAAHYTRFYNENIQLFHR